MSQKNTPNTKIFFIFLTVLDILLCKYRYQFDISEQKGNCKNIISLYWLFKIEFATNLFSKFPKVPVGRSSWERNLSNKLTIYLTKKKFASFQSEHDTVMEWMNMNINISYLREGILIAIWHHRPFVITRPRVQIINRLAIIRKEGGPVLQTSILI